MSMKHVEELLARWNWILEHHHHDEGTAITMRDALVSLEVAIRQDDTPQIIRTVDELEALDPDTVVYTPRRDNPVYVGDFLSDIRYDQDYADDLPAVVITPADQVRAARTALEEAADV